MDLFTELGYILQPEKPTLTCNKCKHNQAWECYSKVFHYCGIRQSKLTSNGLMKIKCKDVACNLFETK